MSPLLLALLIFAGVALLVGGAAMLLNKEPSDKIADRLDLLTGAATPSTTKNAKEGSILYQPLDNKRAWIDSFAERFANIDLLFEQADTNLTMTKLAVISAVLAGFGFSLGALVRIHAVLIPLAGVVLGASP